ncbi:MAG TPA: cytochrome c biogenesis protein CcsA, partial [Planctomycetia bacterium]|nr:cytochrome c biogenesis protein CcsA [Planctomycetia bacterium]
IKKGVPQLPAHELARLNRLLLSQAFPTALKPAPKLGTRDPVAEKKYDPVELYLTWLFTWQGWDQLESGAAASWNLDQKLYWNVHKGDGWDRTPILSSGYIDLMPLLQPETEKSVSADTPAQNASFVNWLGTFAADLEGLDGKAAEKYFEALSEAERRGFRTAQNAGTFRSLRQGLHLRLGPPEDADHKASEPAPRWLPLFRLLMPTSAALKSPYTEKTQEQIRKSFLAARKAFLSDDAAAFASASKEFAAALESATGPYANRLVAEHEAATSTEGAKTSAGGLAIFDWLDSGKKWDSYPSQKILDLEVHYNRFEPCTKAAILAFIAAAIIGLSMAFRSKALYALGYAGLFGTLGLMAYAMYLRSTISGRAPVSNMYETIIWASFIAGSLGSILGLVYRGRKVLPLVATLLLGLSNLMVINLPPVMGSNITPLMAVLRSQKWLVVHVMTIVASYGAFMLAWLLSLFGLAHYFRANPDPAETKLMGRFAYLSMQVGVLLLATGTWLGGVWAKDSWGRFWGWDPKEVWALIALIAYLIVLHLRFVGVKAFGTMVGSSLAFTMVVASWYGVNFLFPGGLHAYAINTGGQMFVISGVIANLAYVGAVLFARRMHRLAAARGTPSETTSGLENLAN